MQTVFITLAGPTRQIDLKVPAEVPIGDLLPRVLELCGSHLIPPHMLSAQWHLVLPDRGVTLSPARSLQDNGIVDGSVLLLQDSATVAAARQQQAMSQPFRPQFIQPGANTGGIGVKWNIPDE